MRAFTPLWVFHVGAAADVNVSHADESLTDLGATNTVSLVPVQISEAAALLARGSAPSVVSCVAASASSSKARPAAVMSASAAAPAPVKYGSLSAALVNPARAANSAS